MPAPPRTRDEQQVRRPQGERVSQDHGGDQIEAGQGVAEGQDEDQEDAGRHDVPALDLVRVDQGPDVSRLGILPGKPGRHVRALDVAEELVGAAPDGLPPGPWRRPSRSGRPGSCRSATAGRRA